MKKYIAKIVIETTSVLVVGSGKSSLDNDAVVAKDWNFLPYIPGTGLLGIVQSLFEKKFGSTKQKELFGGEDAVYKNKEKETFKGSSFEISDALLVDENGEVQQQLVLESELSSYYKHFLSLPKREHVKINYKGVTAGTGKFDTEFVYKGARFMFEVEMQGNDTETDNYWNFILNSFKSTDFMIGSGTTNGYGQIEVVSLHERIYNLNKKDDLVAYLNHSTNLNDNFIGSTPFNFNNDVITNSSLWKKQPKIALTNKAIHIGAGYGDGDVDACNYREMVIKEWKNDKPEWKEYFVIPGTSIKGAIAHRVAYLKNLNAHNNIETIIASADSTALSLQNKKTDNYFDVFEKELTKILNHKKTDLTTKKKELGELKTKIRNFSLAEDTQNNIVDLTEYTENNSEVKRLFGSASNDKNKEGSVGSILFNDVYVPLITETNFEHNAIDRFTGGTMDTALYSEKVYEAKNITLCYYTHKDIETALLDKALEDLKKGNLAIGGKTNKGYGYFNEKKA